MVNQNVLVVPIEVKALVVNDRVRVGQNFQRWSMDYEMLDRFLSPEPRPFSSNANDWAENPKNNGIYLHWTLPRAFRQGAHDAESSRTAFPLVPNRWLVLRYSGPLASRKATAWIVESDFLDPNDGTSPYIDPFSSDLQVTAIGRKVDLATWKERPGRDLFLTAISPANAAFAAYQPYCENLFSIHDPLADVAPVESLSYLVAGWYSDPRQDPLAASSDFAAVLKRLNWAVENPGDRKAAISIYEGVVYAVAWNKNGEEPPSNRPARTGIAMAVGHTAVDSLTALIAQQAGSAGVNIDAKLLEAFQYDLLPLLDQPNGEEIVANRIHEHWFGAQSGGYMWEIVHKPGTDSAPPPSQPLAPPGWLMELNRFQSQYDQEARILREMQWNLYALWYKQQYASKLPSIQYPSDITRAMFAAQLNPTNRSGALYRLYEQYIKVQMLRTEIAQVQARPLPDNQELKRVHAPSFWQANNPVVLFAGAKASEQLVDERPLPCRFAEQVVTGFTYQGRAITAAAMTGGVPTLPMAHLPAVMIALVHEFFFLDPTNATLVATRALGSNRPESIRDVQAAMADRKGLIGKAPAFDLNPWKQPWAPLFLMWEVRYYPIPYEANGRPTWNFNGTRYEWSGEGANSKEPLVYSGRIFLTPQASFHFKERLKRYLATHPNPHLQALEHFINQTYGWDFLSQALDGFQQQLALRDPLANRTPSTSEILFAPDLTLAKLLSTTAEYAPQAGPTRKIPFEGWPPSAFQQWRAGQFYFTRMVIVDRFGQAVEVVNPSTSAQFAPVVASELKPTTPVLPQEPYRFVQAPPRLLQPARLLFQFVSPINDAQILPPVVQINPVCAWVLPNHLDQSLSFYSPAGAHIGELYVVTDNRRQRVLWWEGTPGGTYGDLATVARDFPHLGSVVQALVALGPERGPAACEALLRSIDQTLWTIDPLGERDNQNLSVLIGRPLALVRTRLRLQLNGPAIADPSWRYTFQPQAPDFLNYRFAVRLGDPAIRQDGLLGYFVGNDYNRFHALYIPDGSAPPPYLTQIGKGNWINLQANPSSPPTYLTLLVDPRAEVYAYTDILPVRAIAIPRPWVASALAKMEVLFHTGPLLSDMNMPTSGEPTVVLPHPAEKKGAWSWLEWEGERLRSYGIAPSSQEAILSNIPPRLRTGFLKRSGAIDPTE